MDEAKGRELAEWVQGKAIRVVTEGTDAPKERIMSMRWVLSWKPSAEEPSGRKAKARIVLLGYRHPELSELTVSSPKLSRLERMLTLQWCAVRKAHLECADAKCAFLQGDGKEMDEQEPIYARVLGEVACAFNIP